MFKLYHWRGRKNHIAAMLLEATGEYRNPATSEGARSFASPTCEAGLQKTRSENGSAHRRRREPSMTVPVAMAVAVAVAVAVLFAAVAVARADVRNLQTTE